MSGRLIVAVFIAILPSHSAVAATEEFCDTVLQVLEILETEPARLYGQQDPIRPSRGTIRPPDADWCDASIHTVTRGNERVNYNFYACVVGSGQLNDFTTAQSKYDAFAVSINACLGERWDLYSVLVDCNCESGDVGGLLWENKRTKLRVLLSSPSRVAGMSYETFHFGVTFLDVPGRTPISVTKLIERLDALPE